MVDKIIELNKMISEDPSDPFLHYALGLEYAKKKNFQEAMSAFQTVLNLDENYIAAYYQLALLFIEIDIIDVARSYINKGIEKATIKRDHRSKGELQELLDSFD